jgi:UDP-glucose 4-epimerase
MPFIAQVAIGKLPVLSIYGTEYNTPDGLFLSCSFSK